MKLYTVYLMSGEKMLIQAERFMFTQMDLSFFDKGGALVAFLNPQNYCAVIVEETAQCELLSSGRL